MIPFGVGQGVRSPPSGIVGRDLPLNDAKDIADKEPGLGST